FHLERSAQRDSPSFPYTTLFRSEIVLGDIAGAPGILPYAEDVYKYMRQLEKATPRVKVYSIGTTEEGREMIAVAVSSEENLKHLDRKSTRLNSSHRTTSYAVFC